MHRLWVDLHEPLEVAGLAHVDINPLGRWRAMWSLSLAVHLGITALHAIGDAHDGYGKEMCTHGIDAARRTGGTHRHRIE